jgi:hypothetical protein
MQVEVSGLLFETPEQIYARVFRELKPRTELPEIEVAYRRYASAHALIRLREGRLEVRISDALEGAPAPVQEALAYILLGKLYRKTVARAYHQRYRLYMNRQDMRRQLHLMKQIRGRKYVSGPQGAHFNLEELFEGLNLKYFDGLMGRPELGWSRQASRVTLGHYDPSHNAIILSRILDRAETPRLLVEYILYHEMLHLRHPVDHRGARRRVHTREFREAEKRFEGFQEANELMKRL